MNTRGTILDTALSLFNQQGTAAVSTNHIAQAAEISPGNLYYHYRNKQEIIRALFERLFDEWDGAFGLPQDREPALEDLKRLVGTNFEILWKYQFIYRELVSLLRQDPLLARRYALVRQRGFEGFRELFAHFSASGVVRAAGPGEINEMAELCWLVSEFWLASRELEGSPLAAGDLEHGIQLMLRVLQPGQ